MHSVFFCFPNSRTYRNSLYIINSTFAYQEVKGVQEVKVLRRMSCCLKKIRQKDCCLNSSATVGSDNSLTPLTSELAKLE